MTYDADIAGARASNAGDDFHILWALRHALRVLDQASNLAAVTVEGFPSSAAGQASQGAWDGVDIGLFYGGGSLTTASRVDIEQLKYSTGAPNKAWTMARLCYSSSRSGNNSVMAQLAKAFVTALKLAPQLTSSDVRAKLVSNQPIHQDVQRAIAAHTERGAAGATAKTAGDWHRLQVATGLKGAQLVKFVKALDFSECQGPSRFQVHLRVAEAIAELAASDGRQAMLELRNVVYTRMLPGDSSPITREVILSAMFVSDPQALLPCPAEIKRVANLVSRAAAVEIARDHFPVMQRVCLHGEGGCGKTTALQEIAALLPPGSEMFVFDCYGGGRYQDSDGQRHLGRHALLQLSNEMAARLGAPMLITASSAVDYLQEFGIRLRRAAKIVRARQNGALLVLAIDAADNSVTAAQMRMPPERSFVHDVAELGQLPENVRVLISARTGRRSDLRLPQTFHQVVLGNLARDEAEQLIGKHWKEAPAPWIDDMHALSGGNPRVISYAFDYAADEPERALEYLRPNGKVLRLIFGERISDALRKGGNALEFDKLCAGLVTLPRPIPMAHLAAILRIDEAHIRDLCNDLAPGLRRDDAFLSFADEDFEAFIQERAAPGLQQVRNAAAGHLLANHLNDAYSAEHVAIALVVAGDAHALLHLADKHPEPRAIKDPVRRREVQLLRLKLAMQVARGAGRRSEAILVLLRGARALKTDAAIRKMLTDNIDLSARFAQSSLRMTVLQGRESMAFQGRALCHLMLDSAMKNDAVRTRDWGRQFGAWLAAFASRDREARPKWLLDRTDIAAEGEAILRVAGAKKGIATLRRWRPKRQMPRVIDSVVRRLLASGQQALVESVLKESPRVALWDVLVRVPLALAGGPVNLGALRLGLGRWVKRGWLDRAGTFKELAQTGNYPATVRLLLTAAEVIVSREGMCPEVREVLQILSTSSWRSRASLRSSASHLIDVSLRAHSLLEAWDGRVATLESYLGPAAAKPPETVQKPKGRKPTPEEDRTERLEKFVAQILPIYNARASCLCPTLDITDRLKRFQALINGYGGGLYGRREEYDVEAMRECMAEGVATLLHLRGCDSSLLVDTALRAAAVSPSSLSREQLRLLSALAMHQGSHDLLHTIVVSNATATLTEKSPATERAERLIELARVLMPISPSDSESLFANASSVLEGVDIDNAQLLSMLEPFAKAAATSLDEARRRTAACQIADVAGDVWTYLGDQGHFPWSSIANSTTVLSACVSLAVATRWDDAGVVRLRETLPDILSTGLEVGSFGGVDAVPLLCLGAELDSRVLGPLSARVARRSDSIAAAGVAEELARLAFFNVDGLHGMTALRAALGLAAPSQSSLWVARGRELLQYHDDHVRKSASSPASTVVDDARLSEMPARRRFTITAGRRYVDRAAIEAEVASIRDEARHSKDYVDIIDVLRTMGQEARPMDRRAHLEALAQCDISGAGSDLASAISEAVRAWSGSSPSVASWCAARLPGLLADRLPFFFRAQYGWDTPLPEMLKASGLPAEVVCDSILQGLELHANEWTAGAVYRILAAVAPYLTPSDATDVLTELLTREVNLIGSDQPRFDPNDTPQTLSRSIGRMLYALMGDADLRVRWCAAHAMRAAARLGRQEVIDAIFEQWDRTREPSFRHPEAPFYWLAARLWCLIGAQRIAEETPTVLARHVRALLEIATDDAFPHLLCRHFAKGAVQALVRQDVVTLRATETAALKRVNTSTLRRKAVNPTSKSGFGRFADMDNRRFHFDSTDTLPYWYSAALKCFADVSGTEFLDVAEKWVVDHWHSNTELWQWKNEPRKYRFEREHNASSNRHGSLPTIERAHTHLEWHAMWVTAGELLRTRPLAKGDDNDFERWNYWWSRAGLTQPPFWLSDLRTGKPMEEPLWFPEASDDTRWTRAISDDSLLAHTGLLNDAGDVVVAGHITQREGDRRSTVNVSSALVSPETASALLRALQTVGSAWDYKIPGEGEHMEIDEPPYRLLGWLRHPEHDTRLDDDDALRREVAAFAAIPGESVSKHFGLVESSSNPLAWVDAEGSPAFWYVAWSDDMSDAASRSDGAGLRSYGHRLVASRQMLLKYLAARKLDLIIEVDLTRRLGDIYGDDDSENSAEARYDFVIVLRRDGTVEGAGGRIGTWAVPRARARNGGGRRHARPMDGASPGGTPDGGRAR